MNLQIDTPRINAIMPRIYQIVERRGSPKSILSLLNIGAEQVWNYTYESCSFVVAMKDRKTCLEVCFSPELIHIFEDSDNPLFNAKRRNYDR